MTAARPGNNLKAELAQFKRRRIREEASHLFYRHGYEGTTIDAIADKLQVTKPFIYSYYKNKGEILYDIAKLGITLSLEALERCLVIPGSSWDQLKLVVDEGRALRREIPYRMLFTRVNPAIATRDEKEIRSQFRGAGIPTFETALNDRAGFRAMFTHYRSLWSLGDDQATGLDKARINATAFVQEVVTEIRRQNAVVEQTA